MQDHLRESSQQAAQMTQASLPYIEKAADFGTPAIQGFQAGQQIAGEYQRQQIAGRQLLMQESQHEAEMQDLATKAQLYQGELALRRDQAATQTAEAQASIARVRGMYAEMPPRKNADGSWSQREIGDNGQTTWVKLDPQDYRVQEQEAKLAQEAADTAARQAQAKMYEAQAGFYDIRDPGGGKAGGTVSGKDIKDALTQARANLGSLTGYQFLNGVHYEGDDLKNAIDFWKGRVDFYQKALDGLIQRASEGKSRGGRTGAAATGDGTTPPPVGQNGTAKAPTSILNQPGSAPVVKDLVSANVQATIQSSPVLNYQFHAIDFKNAGISPEELLGALGTFQNEQMYGQRWDGVSRLDTMYLNILHDLNSSDPGLRESVVKMLRQRLGH